MGVKSSSATLSTDIVEDLLEWHPRLAGRALVPQPVEPLQPAFALSPRPLLCWRARIERIEFPGEVFEQDLLFRFGQLVTAASISESVLILEGSTGMVRLRQARR